MRARGSKHTVSNGRMIEWSEEDWCASLNYAFTNDHRVMHWRVPWTAAGEMKDVAERRRKTERALGVNNVQRIPEERLNTAQRSMASENNSSRQT